MSDYRDRFWQLDLLVAQFCAGDITRYELARRHADLLAEMRAEVSAPAESEPMPCTFDETPPF